MSAEADGVQTRIAALEAALADQTPGSAEHRGTQVALAAALAACYAQHGGGDDDRVRAERIATAVLADEQATREQRQSMSMLLPTLTMLSATPAAALRGHGPGVDMEALRRTEQWQASTGTADMLAGIGKLLTQIDAIEDVSSLPPQIQSSIAMVKAAMGLLGDTQRPGWDGQVAPEVRAQMRSAVAEAHPDVPGVDLMRGLVTWVEGFDEHGERDSRTAELDAAIARLSGDELLVPVLRTELAKALISGSDLGGPAAVLRVTTVLEQAVEGMPPDHPFYAETVRMLAGAMVAAAGDEPTDARQAQAEHAVAQALSHSTGEGRAAEGERLFLQSLLGVLRSVTHGGREAEAPMRELIDCIDRLPRDHPLHAVAVGQLGAVLADRSLMAGLRADTDAAVDILDDAVRAAAGSDPVSGALIACLAQITQVNRAMQRNDVEELRATAGQLRQSVEVLPAEHLARANIDLVLAVADLRIAVASGAGVREAIGSVRSVAEAGGLAGVPAGVSGSLVDAIDTVAGLLDAAPDAVLGSIARMEAGLTSGGAAAPYQRAGQRALLGKAYLAALGSGLPSEEAAGRAVEHLEEARRLLDYRAGVPLADVLRDLAVAYRARGDRNRSRRVAFEALEAHAGAVLLQSETAHAIGAAQGASADATRLARWCLADGDLGGAVEAAELGRGLVLHAATSVIAVPTLLADIGEPELAARWRDAQLRPDAPPWAVAAVQSAPPPAAPDLLQAIDDLRHRVIEALQGTAQGIRLFQAPSTPAMGEALRAVGAEVLAYVLPGDDNEVGQVLLVDRRGTVTGLEVPSLRDEVGGPLDTYLEALRPGRAGYTREWRSALVRLCDWAGEALLGPLLLTLRGRGDIDGGVPRVVLVPGGRLGAVPWQAARVAAGPSGFRYACQDLALSAAASARQLIDVASRNALPLQKRPVLVADPTGDMPGARDEVLALRAACYPDAVVLGDIGTASPAAAGPGTPAELLACLPGGDASGASLVHLGCHAVAANEPDRSFIALAGPLSVTDILRHGTGRSADAPGPVIVASACETDFTVRDYDEALTLATALLACGAVAVVGSRWAVPDRTTAAVMFAFHHFLAIEGLPPADALRAAQLWMLDLARSALPGMSPELARLARRPSLAELETWAAFGHHGR